MKSIRRILFPIDFSARSQSAAEQVVIWAKQFTAEVVALHIIDPHNYVGDSDREEGRFYEMKPAIDQETHEDLDFFCKQYLPDLNVRAIVNSGDTAPEIASFAESEKVDLVMLPRRHQSVMSRVIGDSISGKVLDTCPIDIWTSEHLEALEVAAPKHILCPLHIGDEVSLDAANERLLDSVRTVTNAFGAELTCLYIGGASVVSLPDIARRLVGIQHEIREIGNLEIVSGNVSAKIQEAAREHNADLIMVGRSRPGAVELGVQVPILKIDHHADCPVLSIF